MKEKIEPLIIALVILLSMTTIQIKFAKAGEIIVVPVDYPTIQEAVNHANEGDTIYVHNGTYYENIVVNKAVSLVGEDRSNTIIDGNGSGDGIFVSVDNVSIIGFTIQNFNRAIKIDRESWSQLVYGVNVSNNLIRNSSYGLNADQLWHGTISGNNFSDNQIGIDLGFAGYNRISDNIVRNNFYGILLSAVSISNRVSGNIVTKNRQAIDLYGQKNMVCRNTVSNNLFGIYLGGRYDRVFHNNVIRNKYQALTPESRSTINFLDNGHEGNYWSNYRYYPYNGEDIDRDGIGDVPYVVDENNRDNYPLMGMFSDFNATSEHHVNVISNSIIEDFEYFESNNTIKMHVSKYSMVLSFGFCRLCIPKDLMSPPYTVMIDNGLTKVLYFNNMIHDNDTHRWIYFAYPHSTHEIMITNKDITPPVIGNVSQQPAKDIYPDDKVEVYATVTDDISGIKQVVLNYTTDNGTWVMIDMTNLEGNLYNATIEKFPHYTNVTYIIIAEDNANNTITFTTEGMEYNVISEFPSMLIMPLFMIATLLAAVRLIRRKQT